MNERILGSDSGNSLMLCDKPRLMRYCNTMGQNAKPRRGCPRYLPSWRRALRDEAPDFCTKPKLDCFADAKKKQRIKALILLRGRCRWLSTSPEGIGRREAPGEGLRSIDGAKPLTRIAKAIRPLPTGEVPTARSLKRVGRSPVLNSQ